ELRKLVRRVQKRQEQSHNVREEGVQGTNFTIVNKCNYMVRPGILSNVGVSTISNTGFTFRRGESKTIYPRHHGEVVFGEGPIVPKISPVNSHVDERLWFREAKMLKERRDSDDTRVRKS
ncbi:hypothetical protein Golax_023198, partial [Gossypium laxum]|nr:hypothetical protein [Gossypium laxum]